MANVAIAWATSLRRLKRSLADSAPVFNRGAMKRPCLTIPEFVLCRQRPGSAFIACLSSLLGERTQTPWDFVVKLPKKVGGAWPFAHGRLVQVMLQRANGQTDGPGAIFCPGINDTLNFRLLNTRFFSPPCLHCFTGRCLPS